MIWWTYQPKQNLERFDFTISPILRFSPIFPFGGFTGLRDGCFTRVADRSERSTDAVSGCRGPIRKGVRKMAERLGNVGNKVSRVPSFPPWYGINGITPTVSPFHPRQNCAWRSSSMCPPVWRRQRDLAALNHPWNDLRCFSVFFAYFAVTSWGLAINLIFLQHYDTGRDRNVRKMVQWCHYNNWISLS